MRRIFTGMVFICAGLVAGCGERESAQIPDSGNVENVVAMDFSSNRLEGLPGEVYRSQKRAPVNWQPWTRETLDAAKASNRLILAMIVLPQQPSYAASLRELYASDTTVREINDSYMPVLIDGDAVREIGILTADLCAEIGSGLQLPMLVWMTPEANPVAWIPLPAGNTGTIAELFSQSHIMVGRMWQDDPGYVSDNSGRDQANRRERMLERIRTVEMGVDPAADSVRALRQLTSLYDPVSRTFDEAGGLFPCGAIDLLSMGARTTSLPDEIRERSRTTLEFILGDLLPSPMFDPLDGGIYSSRRGTTWSLPGYYRDCATQARVVVSLLDAYEVTGDKRALDRAMGVLDFIESHYRTADGLYGLGSGAEGKTEDWLWTVEDVRKHLDDEEASVVIKATGMKDVGNLPSEVDPLREFFRSNSLGFVKSPEEIASETGADPADVRDLLGGARRKLLKVRDARLRESVGGTEAHAAATFRVVSANAAAYRITGDTKFRDHAVKILETARQRFSHGPTLKLYPGDAPPSLTAARAFVYAVAMQAAIDVSAVTLDESWLLWADDLATTITEIFATDTYLRECPPEADLIGLPVTDLAMLFDESTAGLISMAQSRMDALDRPVLKSFGEQVKGIPMGAVESPILHTDIIQASLMREYGRVIVYGSSVPENIRKMISRSPLKGTSRKQGQVTTEDGTLLSAEGVAVIEAGKKARLLLDLSEIGVPSLRNP